jgi:hypothetical protein
VLEDLELAGGEAELRGRRRRGGSGFLGGSRLAGRQLDPRAAGQGLELGSQARRAEAGRRRVRGEQRLRGLSAVARS